MSVIDIPIEDFFPVIRQTMLDTYNLEAFLFRYPYEGFDKLDKGVRKLLLGNNVDAQPMYEFGTENGCHMVAIGSKLGFYNIICFLSEDENPDIIAFAPFRIEPFGPVELQKIMTNYGVAMEHKDALLRLYMGLPVLKMDDLTIAIRHLIGAFVEGFTECRLEHVDYTGSKVFPKDNETRMEEFKLDFAKEFVNRIFDCTKAVASGQQSRATEKMKSLVDFMTSFFGASTSEERKTLRYLNDILSYHMYTTMVHPNYIITQWTRFSNKIEETTSLRELQNLPFEMARRYCMLAKNYTYQNYSYLVRDVVNYIDEHLTEEITLSILAEEFEKNPSYLSNTFKKEVGKTVTDYINEKRIGESLRLLNTTSMSIADVSQKVGIIDFSYFSKLFKKYVKVSPREYKKMINK